MTSKTSKAASPLTFAKANALAKAFRPSETVIAARVRAVMPYAGTKSAATIVDEVWEAFEREGVVLTWAFGESTIQTSLNVAAAYASLPASARKALSREDETTILDALVGIRRTRATIPVSGRKNGLAGGAKALATTIGKMAKAEPRTWASVCVGEATTLAKAEAADRRGRAAGKRAIIADSDETIADDERTHDERASEARKGDEKAEKRNESGKRASKNERASSVRDPLEPAKDGNPVEALPGSGASKDAGKAPAKVLALADADLAATIRHMRALLADERTTITPTLDTAFTALADAWEARARTTTLSAVA